MTDEETLREMIDWLRDAEVDEAQYSARFGSGTPYGRKPTRRRMDCAPSGRLQDMFSRWRKTLERIRPDLAPVVYADNSGREYRILRTTKHLYATELRCANCEVELPPPTDDPELFVVVEYHSPAEAFGGWLPAEPPHGATVQRAREDALAMLGAFAKPVIEETDDDDGSSEGDSYDV